MNELTKTLKDCVGKGNRFQLEQVDEFTVIFSITGGISDIKIRLPLDAKNIIRTGEVVGLDCQAFVWESNELTSDILISAIESMPEEAQPTIIIDTNNWTGGGLLLRGVWNQKGRGRSKELIERHRTFLIDTFSIK